MISFFALKDDIATHKEFVSGGVNLGRELKDTAKDYCITSKTLRPFFYFFVSSKMLLRHLHLPSMSIFV